MLKRDRLLIRVNFKHNAHEYFLVLALVSHTSWKRVNSRPSSFNGDGQADEVVVFEHEGWEFESFPCLLFAQLVTGLRLVGFSSYRIVVVKIDENWHPLLQLNHIFEPFRLKLAFYSHKSEMFRLL